VTCTGSPTYTGAAIEPCSVSVTGANLSLTPAPVYANNVDAGTNTASASYTFTGDANHTGSSDSKNFSIGKRTLTASIIGNPTKTYDGNTTATLNSGNYLLSTVVGGQSITVTKIGGTYNSKDVATANNVSTTLVSGDFTAAAGTNLNNYNLPTAASGAGHITPKGLAITAENKSFLFGGTLPTFTATYDAFVAGEGLSNLTGTLTFAIKDALNIIVPFNASTPAGTYTIIPSGLTSTNYTISFVNGILTIGGWTITGFYQPVDMIPVGVLNTVKGGSTVPMKFNIYAGTPGPTTERKSISDVLSFQYQEFTCGATGTFETPIEVTTTGSTSLRYDTTGGQFIENWQTPKGANKCYQVRMTALDGSHIDAYFKTK
jgi:hypothetical protein